MIGALVIFYLFLGGCGAGVLGATSAWSLAFHRSLDRTLSQTRAFESLMTRCYVAGFADAVRGGSVLAARSGPT